MEKTVEKDKSVLVNAKDVIVETDSTSTPKKGKRLDMYLDEISKEVYLTEETVVGTFFDGKPIYKAYINDVTNGENAKRLLSNVDTIVDKSIWIKSKYSNYWQVPSVAGLVNTQYEIDNYIESSDDKCLVLILGTSFQQSNLPIKGWIKYTKTTD